MARDNEILLESGTNELNILKLAVGKQGFGINALKIREILPFKKEKLTRVVDQVPSFIGMYLFRDMTVPVIDLRIKLKKDIKEDSNRQVILITEFNKKLTGFLIDEAMRIYRISWDQIEAVPKIFEKSKVPVTGSLTIENEDILILDLEAIVAEIFPETALSDSTESVIAEKPDRSQMRIFIAEDSNVVRNTMLKILKKAGYEHVSAFIDGKDAWEKIAYISQQDELGATSMKQHLNLLISDIEMPQLDGLTLCKRVKKELQLDIPVVMFSSMINDQMIMKCKDVGADNYISKPQIGELVDIIDDLLGVNPE